MSLIPHSLFPRSMFDTTNWWHPTQAVNTLDVFDPFDQLDHTIANNLNWLSRPEFMPALPMLPLVPQKWRVTVDCVGYMPSSIKTDIHGHKLTVTGREETKQEDGEGFVVKEFKKTYDLPAHAQTDKLVSFMTPQGQLVVEMPLKETHLHPNDDLLPRIVKNTTGGQDVELKFHVPENIHPEHVKVSIKDRDLIIKAEDKVVKPDGVSKFYFYKRTTMPENTDFEKLKCTYDNHKLMIWAPLDLKWQPIKKVAIESKKA